MNPLNKILSLFVVIILLIQYCGARDNYANSPYTVPYMNEKISPMATFKCIYHPMPLVVNKSFSLT